MELDASGLVQLCSQEMETASSSLSFLQEIGPIVNSMVSCSLVEEDFLKLSQLLRKELRLMMNGRKLDTWFSIVQP